jgi:cytochrome P450
MQLGQESLLALTDYFRELVARRRSEPADDLVSSLLAAQEAGQKLTEEELLILCATLLTAGHETTTYLIGNAMLALLRHPAEMEKLRQDPSLAPTAVEESLRYDPSIQRVWRVATEDLEWGGKEIRRGQLVVQLLGAANRDPERFAEPHTFNMARTDLTHVAFGHGIHFCLGAPLARLEAQIALVALTSRLRDLRLANDGPLQWHENLAFRGLKALPVAFG